MDLDFAITIKNSSLEGGFFKRPWDIVLPFRQMLVLVCFSAGR